MVKQKKQSVLVHFAIILILKFGNVNADPSVGSYDCLIEPTQVIELASPVTGVLDQVWVQRGDLVKKNQIIARLESRVEQAATDLARYKSQQTGDLHTAESKVEFSKRKYIRKQKLASESLLADQDKDDAEAEYKLAQSELEVAKENREVAHLEFRQQSASLALRTLKSPFNGVVVEQMAFPGEVVGPGLSKKAVFKLAQLDPLRIQVILPKEMFGKISPGISADVQPEIPGKNTYKATVKSVDRLIDAASGTFVSILDLPNPSMVIPAGIKCRAVFGSK